MAVNLTCGGLTTVCALVIPWTWLVADETEGGWLEGGRVAACYSAAGSTSMSSIITHMKESMYNSLRIRHRIAALEPGGWRYGMNVRRAPGRRKICAGETTSLKPQSGYQGRRNIYSLGGGECIIWRQRGSCLGMSFSISGSSAEEHLRRAQACISAAPQHASCCHRAADLRITLRVNMENRAYLSITALV